MDQLTEGYHHGSGNGRASKSQGSATGSKALQSARQSARQELLQPATGPREVQGIKAPSIVHPKIRIRMAAPLPPLTSCALRR